MTTIDLNCDLGESFGPWEMGNDAAMIELATSVNVACGFHAGDADIMRKTVELAKARGVSVGAHPGYRDLHGFGRRPVPGMTVVGDREPGRLPDRRVAGDRDRRRPQGHPCQGAWRAVQRRLRGRHDRASDRQRDQGGRSQSDLRGARQFEAGARPAKPPICRWCMRCSPTAPMRTTASLVSRSKPGAVLHDRQGDRRARGADGAGRRGGVGDRQGHQDAHRHRLHSRRHAGAVEIARGVRQALKDAGSRSRRSRRRISASG